MPRQPNPDVRPVAFELLPIRKCLFANRRTVRSNLPQAHGAMPQAFDKASESSTSQGEVKHHHQSWRDKSNAIEKTVVFVRHPYEISCEEIDLSTRGSSFCCGTMSSGQKMAIHDSEAMVQNA